MNSFEAFALNLIAQPIALINEKENSLIIKFANFSFIKLLQTTDIENKSEEEHEEMFRTLFKEEYEIFKNICQKCLKDQKPAKNYPFTCKEKSRKRFPPLFASFYPYDEYSICVLLNTKANDSLPCKCNILYFENQKEELISLGSSNMTKFFPHCSEEDFSFPKSQQLLDIIDTERTLEYICQSCGEDQKYTKEEWKFIGRNEETQCPQFMVSLCDVTNEKKLEDEILKLKKEIERLNEMNESFRIFFDTTDVVMGVVEIMDNNTDIKWVMVNPAQTRQYGIDVTGKRSHAIGLTEEQKEFWIKKYRHCEKLNHPIQFEVRDYYQDRHWWCSIQHHHENRFFYLSTDVTELKTLEKNLELQVKARTAQLEEALEVKSRFLATMSHGTFSPIHNKISEMRTPMSGIISSMTLLNDTKLTDEQTDVLRIAQVCGQQLLTVIDDILDYTKLEANKLILEKIPFSLTNLIEQTIEIMGVTAEKKQIELVGLLDDSVPEFIIGDKTRLMQILMNLLNNSCKFSSRGEIVLRVWTTNKDSNNLQINFSVQDEGIGITEEVKKNLFRPFVQADTSSKRRYEGSGLGLTISKHLAEMMGGTLWFESEPNKGSTFYFTILAQVTLNENKTNPIPPIEGRVLIIENGKAPKELLLGILSNIGLTCITMNRASEALRYLNSTPLHNIRLVLSDAKEERSEIDLIQKIVPSVLLMGYSQSSSNRDLPFVRKPIKKSSLIEVVLSQFQNAEVKQKIKEERIEQADVPVESIKILVAEDNVLNQKIISKILESLKYKNVTIVENGKQAVDAVKSNHFDIVLMDMMMPEMGGLEATELIRKENLHQPIVIALTADAFIRTEKHKCATAGINDIILKPIDRTHLMEVLRHFSKRVNSQS